MAVPSSPLTLLVATTGTIERLQSRPPLTGRRRESTTGLTDAARTARTRTRLKQVSRMARSAFRRCSKATRKPRDSKLFTRLSTQGEDLRAPVRSTSNRDATSMAPRFPSSYSVRLGSCDRRDQERTRTRPIDFCNPHFKDEHSHAAWLPARWHSKLCATGWLRVQRRSAGFGSADPAAAAGILDPLRARRLTFWCPVTVRQLAARAFCARARIRTTKIASTAAPLRATAFPTEDTFHRQAALASRVRSRSGTHRGPSVGAHSPLAG